MPKKRTTKKTTIKKKVISEDEEVAVLEPLDVESPKVEKQELEPVKDWKPKTELGRKVQAGEITDISEILDTGMSILEPEIVDSLLHLESELLLIGQAKGKFGGGQRRIFRQTQKKTREGNKPKFTTLAVVGNKDGYVGIGVGKSKETVPAREKALKNAKLNIFKISRGNGSWESHSKDPTSIPFAVTGKCGSVELTLKPAPNGKGLVVEKECSKILALAGIKDVWSKSQGQTKNKMNMIVACERALRKLMSTKIRPQDTVNVAFQEGKINTIKEE